MTEQDLAERRVELDRKWLELDYRWKALHLFSVILLGGLLLFGIVLLVLTWLEPI